MSTIILGTAQRQEADKRNKEGKGCHSFLSPSKWPPFQQLYTQTSNAAGGRCPTCTSQGRYTVMTCLHVGVVIVSFPVLALNNKVNTEGRDNDSYISELIWTLQPGLMGRARLWKQTWP